MIDINADGNIKYINYQSEEQMSDYLTSRGYESEISNIFKIELGTTK